jgi:phosphoglycolate phosphatase
MKMKNKFKSVVFDLDGTLVDTIADIAFFMNKALALRDLPLVPEKDYNRLVGWGMKQLAFNALPLEMQWSAEADALSAELAADATRFYGETPIIKTKPYAGIQELLVEVKRREFKTAVLSNKPDAMARVVASAIFPQGSFDVVRGEIAGKPRKPAPEPVWDILMDLDLSPRDTVFLGDSEIDIETALASGCHAVGAGWGFRGVDALVKAGAERVIDKPSDLLEIL